ncbi:MAG: hypothetical protein HY272_03940 [Gammaproteobacteria bacterium]|nr:hypothetical protein [Gammaproteobacteria bacterium]
MTPVLIEVGILLAVLGFLGFLAMDDIRNRRRRAEEDRAKAEQESEDERQD